MNANLTPEQARVALEALDRWEQVATIAPEDTVVAKTARGILRNSVESLFGVSIPAKRFGCKHVWRLKLDDSHDRWFECEACGQVRS